MDGVITQTAKVHARAWKQMFDVYLFRRAKTTLQDFQPLESTDYLEFIDGVPRMEGIKNFLRSRGIDLPEGTPDDARDKETMYWLGMEKNKIFLELIKGEGFEVVGDTIEQVRRWKAAGIKIAVASSSKNATAILEGAKLLHLFDVKIDGNDIVDMKLKGKPAPDMFIRAATDLGVRPAQTVVVEDAQLGVEAGQAGGFGLVVGLDSSENKASALLGHGAHIVVRSLKELKLRDT